MNAGSIVLSHRDDCLPDLEWRFADDSFSFRPIKGPRASTDSGEPLRSHRARQ